MCIDLDVVCVGAGYYTTLIDAVNAVSIGSGIKYILIREDQYTSSTGYPITVNSTHEEGTPEQYITIMPDPSVGGEITIYHDSDLSIQVWFTHLRNYWKWDGDNRLKFVITLTHGNGHGSFYIQGEGKVTIENMIFESDISDSYERAIGIYCGSNCDDENFDNIIIQNCVFRNTYDTSNAFSGLKISINSISATTQKVLLKNLTFDSTYSQRRHIYFPKSMKNYLTEDTNPGYGCHNCEITECTFGKTSGYENALRITFGKDVYVHNNEFNVFSDCDGAPLYFVYNDFLLPNQGIENIVFENNVFNMRGESNKYVLSIDNYGELYNFYQGITFRNNQVNELNSVLMYISIKEGLELDIVGNEITTANYFGNTNLFSFLAYDTVLNANQSVTISSNKIIMDLTSATGATRQWINWEGCYNLNLTIAHNYFEVVGSSGETNFFNLVLNSGNLALGSVNMYANVVFQDSSNNNENFVNGNPDVDSFVTSSFVLEENVWNMDWTLPAGTVTSYTNNVNNDALYDPLDPCASPTFVPFIADVTPFYDVLGNCRPQIGSDTRGPVECSPVECPGEEGEGEGEEEEPEEDNFQNSYFTHLKGEYSESINSSEYSCGIPTSQVSSRAKGTGFFFKNNYGYIFGGYGYDYEGNLGYLNDVWMFQTTDDYDWCFIKGNQTKDMESGLSVTKGEFNDVNFPSSRASFGSFSSYYSFFVLGGELSTQNEEPGLFNDVTNDLWEFNVFSDFAPLDTSPNTKHQWRLLLEEDEQGDQPTKRMGHCVAHFGELDDIMYVFGGRSNSTAYLNDLYEYNILTNTFTKLRGATEKDEFVVATEFVVGDHYELNQFNDSYDPPRRTDMACWVDQDRNFYLFGGQFPNLYATNDVWTNNITGNVWALVSGGENNYLDNNLASGNHMNYDVLNLPAARYGSIFFTNQLKYNTDGGSFILFYGGVNGKHGLVFSDMWAFSNILHEFRFLNGSSSGGGNVAPSESFIGSRSYSIGWTKPNFRVFVFGGSILV